LDGLMLFGFFASFATFVCYLYQHQRGFILAMAVCLAAMAVYGLLQGAIALAIIASLWSAATFGRWRKQRKVRSSNPTSWQLTTALQPPASWVSESRMSRMFGSNSTRFGGES
jgi:hypothetical protein